MLAKLLNVGALVFLSLSGAAHAQELEQPTMTSSVVRLPDVWGRATPWSSITPRVCFRNVSRPAQSFLLSRTFWRREPMFLCPPACRALSSFRRRK